MAGDYDPVECLREEVNRFKDTNTFRPLLVTNFYVQAGCVLSELDRTRQERDRLKGMQFRLEREHNELRAAWENETGKPWLSSEEEP